MTYLDNRTILEKADLALADLTAAAARARRGALVIVDACRDAYNFQKKNPNGIK